MTIEEKRSLCIFLENCCLGFPIPFAPPVHCVRWWCPGACDRTTCADAGEAVPVDMLVDTQIVNHGTLPDAPEYNAGLGAFTMKAEVTAVDFPPCCHLKLSSMGDKINIPLLKDSPVAR